MRGFGTVGSSATYLAAAAVLLGALCQSGNASAGQHLGVGPVQLQHIALQSSPGTAVLMLSFTGPVAQHVFRLHDPERVVIDLPATQRASRHCRRPRAGRSS
jgi:hypothetical protein